MMRSLIILLTFGYAFAITIDTSLKRKINSVELQLNNIEERVNSDSIRTRSDIFSLKRSVLNLILSLTALSDKVSYLPVKTGSNSLILEAASEQNGTETLILDFLNERSWLKNVTKTIEILYGAVEYTTKESIDSIQQKLNDQEASLTHFRFEARKTKRKQRAREKRLLEMEYRIQELNDENMKFRQKVLEMVSPNIDKQNLSCPDAWVLFDKRCYYYDEKISGDFDGVRRYCEKHNAYIADIENILESEFIFSLTGKVLTWTGISDRTEEGVWRSERTHEILRYTAWNPGDPDGLHHQNCALLGWGNVWHRWVDAPCYRNEHFVCKKDAVLDTSDE